MGSTVIQKWKRVFDDKEKVAYKYFSLLSSFNDIHLTEKELQLLTHIALNGITSQSAKKGFLERYSTTAPVLNNLISSLYRKKMLVKSDGRIRIHEKIDVDFSKNDNMVFNIACVYGVPKQH